MNVGYYIRENEKWIKLSSKDVVEISSMNDQYKILVENKINTLRYFSKDNIFGIVIDIKNYV